MSTPAALARALRGRKVGSTWMGCCPAHNDKNPSLSITQKDGKLLAHCHAGCTQDAVITALKERGLWESEEHERPFAERFVCAYDYTDERGALLYQVVRLRDPKDFRQRHPDGHGGWVWKKGQRQVLYRLREVNEAPIVFLVEGEKDAETLRDYGFVGTCEAGGANTQWLPSFTQSLIGREVILIPDNDGPGRLRVSRIARALLGHAARVIIVELEGGPKDVSEWFAAGHSELELIAEVEGPEVTR